MGLISSAIGKVGPFIKNAGACIAKIAHKIGPKLVAGANSILTTIGKIGAKTIEIGKKMIHGIGHVVKTLCSGLKISKAEPQEWGEKIDQDDTRSRDEFESSEEYIKYLDDEVKLDKEKSESRTEEEKCACETVGSALGAEACSEKMGMNITPQFLVMMSKILLNGKISIDGEGLISLLTKLKDGGIRNMDDLWDFFTHTGESDRVKTGSVLVDAVKELDKETKPVDYINRMKDAFTEKI